MPQEFILHETDPFAFYRVGNNAGRPSRSKRNACEYTQNLLEVMSVDLLHAPAERLPFGCQWLKLQHLLYGSQTLNLVVVHDGNQIVQGMMSGKQRRLPD